MTVSCPFCHIDFLLSQTLKSAKSLPVVCCGWGRVGRGIRANKPWKGFFFFCCCSGRVMVGVACLAVVPQSAVSPPCSAYSYCANIHSTASQPRPSHCLPKQYPLLYGPEVGWLQCAPCAPSFDPLLLLSCHFTMVTSPAEMQTCVFFSLTHQLARHCKETSLTPPFSNLLCRALWALDCLCRLVFLLVWVISIPPSLYFHRCSSLYNRDVLVIGPPQGWMGTECTPQLLRFHFVFPFDFSLSVPRHFRLKQTPCLKLNISECNWRQCFWGAGSDMRIWVAQKHGICVVTMCRISFCCSVHETWSFAWEGEGLKGEGGGGKAASLKFTFPCQLAMLRFNFVFLYSGTISFCLHCFW